MKQLCSMVVLVLLLVSVVAPQTRAQNTQNFTIQSFTADYYLSRTDNQVSVLDVTERIVAEFPGSDQNHGILRAIPKEYKDQSLDLTVSSVVDDKGNGVQYAASNEGSNLVLKIGDPNKYVHGITTYVITYSMKNVITFYPDYDELYWDVNGDQWPQQFRNVTARLHVPSDVAPAVKSEQRCYTGEYGAAESTCEITVQDEKEGKLFVFSAKDLSSYETLSLVVGFDKNTFLPDYVTMRQKAVNRMIGVLLMTGIPVLVLLVMLRQWYKYGRDDPGRGVIVPQYVPYKGLDPILADTLLHDAFRPASISAAMICLAVAKNVKIHATEKKGMLWSKSTQYELELLKVPNDVSSLDYQVIQAFFGTDHTIGRRVKLSDLSNKLYQKVAELKKLSLQRLTDTKYFRHNPESIKTKYRTAGIVLLISSFSLIFMVEPLSTFGFISVGVLIGAGLSGLVVLIMARYMPAKTLLGVEARDYLYGLRDYMQLAEADRIRFLQSPKGVKQYGDPGQTETQVKLFERLLPYAMIFGIEKDWAKQFESLYSQPPDWYSSNAGTFNALYLANSIGGFQAASGASFSPPSSSGSSGFGGGGFSGGGGGGGGGGGW